MAAVFVDSPLSAENARSTKINEGPLSLIFPLPETIVQCLFVIGLGSKLNNHGC